MKTYRYLIPTLILTWFIAVVAISAVGGFSNAYNRLGLSVAFAALAPLIVFFVWFSVSKGFREYTLSLSPVLLTAAHSFRLVGFTFVLLEARRSLPAIFALPAGYGDMFIGATAVLVAWKLAEPRRRGAFIAWQLLGVIDLVLAVTLGTTAPLVQPHGIPVTLMTVLPLSLIPTFFVPLFLILHSICIAQARKWQAESVRKDQGFGSVRPVSLNA
ncbi:MAG TPA: hypothetical protein VGF82_24600 [Terracidiphilus sp.]|jgi:hypothetical protein